MLKKLICLVIMTLFSVNMLKAQDTENSSFIIMSSNGYMWSGFDGSGHVNTFLYSPSKLWAYGVDVNVSQGVNRDIERRMFNMSFSPSIYLFPLNVTKHQIYLGVSVGWGYTDISILKGSSIINGSSFLEDFRGVVVGANAGYNYKFKKNWMIGVRACYDYHLLSSIMGLISLGVRF